MYRLLVLVSTVGLVTADVGLGYNYYKPQTNFGPYRGPLYQGSASSSQYNIGYNNANGFNNNGYPGLNAGFQNTANTVYQVNGVKPAIIKGDVIGSDSFQNTVNRYQGVYNTGNNYKESAAYHAGNLGNYANLNEINKAQGSYQLQSQQAQVFKHFYVHAAPEDEEPIKPRTPIVLPPPQKHYKIIFIKAPTQLAGPPQIVPVPQQNEEKTIVYVLVNKPEEAQNIVVPKVEQKPPAKPEVYFIKYNNKEGSQTVIDNIVKDYNKDQSVSFTNIGTGVVPPPPVVLGTFGTSGAQTVNSGSAGSSGVQNAVNSEFNALSMHSSYESKPSTPGISDGTLASIQLENGYNGASSGFNDASSNTGYTGASENTGFSGALTNPGIDSASSSIGLNSASSATLNGATGGSGFGSSTNAYNGASNGNDYSTVSGVLTSTGGAQSVTNSEYNSGIISTSQGLPHETYGIPKFSV